MSDKEIEFKFCLSPQQASTVEAAVRRGSVERQRLQARYFDTADNVLARHRMALRLRKEGANWVQTVKAAGQDSLQRLEHNVDLGPARAGDRLQPDPALHAGTVVGELLQQALAASDAPLAPTYETDVWRLTRMLRVPGGWVELAFDKGRLRAERVDTGKRVTAPIVELELELVRGALPSFVQLAQRWVQRHGLWLSTVSKAEQGERLRAGVTHVPAVKAGPTRMRSATPSGREILQCAVASCLEQILPNASEIAAGSEDAEQIHQLRIGLRRLRTALRELGPLAPGLVDPEWLPPLVQAFRALGELRDVEDVLASAQAQLLAAGGPELTLAQQAHTQNAAAIVRASALQSVLVALMGLVAGAGESNVAQQQGDGADVAPDDGAWGSGVDGLPHVEALAQLKARIGKLHAALVRAGKRYRVLSAEQRHAVRKRLKRQRYLIEFTAEMFGRKPVARYLQLLRPAQDALGEYNDEVVALATWRTLVEADPRAWFGVGWFTAREPAHVQACRSALRQLRTAPRFWED
ncbi:hypothetical protein AAV94_07225 [Lampropedia cohaerens]|uniref:Adenylate cyclase n=1 Tax=Lampropedia cohaerens TaxID=1610491 RepID=A0A0U1PZL1_9BURK|nr:CYTH and CHAD domain-containing protein [Lampropedia cohaerens]KKW67958.1 hypothetical protein AAV94_07225 [Lampropedia cohaerens]